MACRIKLVRTTETDLSTISDLYLNNDKIGYALELPWNDNKEDGSCIPTGVYTAFIRKKETSTRWSYDTIQLNSVVGRTAVQIHRGNIPRNTKGCILPGTSKATDYVGGSEIALNKIMSEAVKASLIVVEITEDLK